MSELFKIQYGYKIADPYDPGTGESMVPGFSTFSYQPVHVYPSVTLALLEDTFLATSALFLIASGKAEGSPTKRQFFKPMSVVAATNFQGLLETYAIVQARMLMMHLQDLEEAPGYRNVARALSLRAIGVQSRVSGGDLWRNYNDALNLIPGIVEWLRLRKYPDLAWAETVLTLAGQAIAPVASPELVAALQAAEGVGQDDPVPGIEQMFTTRLMQTNPHICHSWRVWEEPIHDNVSPNAQTTAQALGDQAERIKASDTPNDDGAEQKAQGHAGRKKRAPKKTNLHPFRKEV